MLHIDFDFGDPDDRGTVRALIDAYENRNADSKATDTSEPETIITQDEHIVQDEEITFESDDDVWNPELDAMLEKLDLSFSSDGKGGSPSSGKIGCRKFLNNRINILGMRPLERALTILKTAWPTGKYKWNHTIILEVWSFCKCMEISDIDINIDQCAHYISKMARRETLYTPDEFAKRITDIPGQATLKMYNFGFQKKNRISEGIIYDRRYQDVIKQL